MFAFAGIGVSLIVGIASGIVFARAFSVCEFDTCEPSGVAGFFGGLAMFIVLSAISLGLAMLVSINHYVGELHEGNADDAEPDGDPLVEAALKRQA